ncbi:probable L-type lectin-domain containing receptor kinase S.5 [Juglans microcarpa x Juglans regia]|uniref:probable L-type lectin-domain containing receptor kinase S.5 n=1 Tax=Juglans microcarpa x Juglans regia TaxID=2249226 RepID=UPI001B7DB434|nr:probable L-type lectin-domain containing receptor kinase S.5 [Juglans microcarpa x Juglans regia]
MFLLLRLFLCTFIIQPCLSYPVEPMSFSFTSFNQESCNTGQLICMGSVTASDGYLSITPDPQQGKGNSTSQPLPLNNVGRVLYSHPLLAWPAIISTTFTIRISAFSNSTASGDGMAFVFAPDHSHSPPDSYGSYLGLLNRSPPGGVVRQLAVELDTSMNDFDPDGNHIGIDTTSIIHPFAAKSLNSTGIDLKSGRDIKCKIDYDGLSNMLLVSVGYSGNPLVNVLSRSIVMSDTVPSSVFVGFTASTGTFPESHQVIDWAFTSVPLSFPSLNKSLEKYDKIKTVSVIVAPIFMALLIIVICVFPSLLRKLKKRVKKLEDIESRSRNAANLPKMYTYKQLSKATHNFSKENLLGRGGFGSVYKGTIFDPPKTIAVKKISATSKQGEREYMAEICTIGRLRHKNLVQLQGWCHKREHLLLVYEYMPNGSLDCFIGIGFLDWKTRYNILTGLASALLYLHEECGNPVVHRDVKPNNVMLDSDYNAHLGDFGLARLLENDASVTTVLAGTPGYLAPEVGYTGKATPVSDVYSFGMVVLEVVCGRRSKGIRGETSLVDYVWNSYGKNELLEVADRMLEGEFDEEEVKRTLILGLACLHPDSMFRPKMRKVVQILLNPNEPLIKLPETRPTGVYISVSSSATASTTTNFGSKSSRSLLHSPVTSPSEIEVDQYD